MPQQAGYSFMNTYYSDQLATLVIKWKRLYSSGLFSLAIEKKERFQFLYCELSSFMEQYL